MAERKSYKPPARKEMRNDPSRQTIWYDTLALPDDATVESEVLPTINTHPVDEAYAIKNIDPRRAFINRHMARSGIIAMEVFGLPRAKRPWRPRV